MLAERCFCHLRPLKQIKRKSGKKYLLKIFNKRWGIALTTIVFVLSGTLYADDNNAWNEIDRIGLYNSIEEGQIVRNIWEDYTQEEATQLLDSLPSTLRSPVYRDVVKRILLSSGKASKEEIDSPALLAKRLSLLIRYGLFEDAQSLYSLAVEKNTLSQDYDLALIGLQLTMLNGDVAPICLDVEAFSEQFRDMPAWRELSMFCQLRFGSNNKVSVTETSFKHFPILKKILTSKSITLSKDQNVFDTLLIYSNNMGIKQKYDVNARDVESLSDLALALAVQSRHQSQKTYQCYAVEAAKRGVKNISFLKKSYDDHKFSKEIFDNGGGNVTLHPCDIPAFFYQKLQKDMAEEDKIILAAAMIDVTKRIPDIALAPMYDHLSVLTLLNHQWRSVFVQPLVKKDTSTTYESVVFPLEHLQKANRLNRKNYIKWYDDQNHKNILRQYNIDPASVLYISSILSGDFNHFTGKNKKNDYEKLFSLTYVEKSLGLGLGFNDYIVQNYSNDNHAAALIKMIEIVGSYQPQDIHLSDIAVILSALKAYKLEKNAIALSFEYLQ